MSGFLSSHCPTWLSTLASSLEDFAAHPFNSCQRKKRIPHKLRIVDEPLSPQTPKTVDEITMTEALKSFAKNKILNAISDTSKVNFQRWCNLHLLFSRVAFALYGEIAAPAYTISSTTRDAISSIKNELRRHLASLARILDIYQGDGRTLPHTDENLTEFEFVAKNLSFVEENLDSFAATGVEIGELLSLESQLQNKIDSVLGLNRHEHIEHTAENIQELKALIKVFQGKPAAPPSDDDELFVSNNLFLIRQDFKKFEDMALEKKFISSPQDQLLNKIHSLQQLNAFYYHALSRSLLFTLGMTGLITSMPYILNAAGNPVLMDTKVIAALFGLSPLTTVFTSMNNSMMDMFAPCFQSRLTTLEWVRDLFQMTFSYLGLHFQNPYVIILGQIISAGVSGIVGHQMLRSLFKQVDTHLPLTQEQKKYVNGRIWAQILGTSASAFFRMSVPITLGLFGQNIAVLGYNVFYFQNWAFLGVSRVIANIYTQGRGLSGYHDHIDLLDRTLNYCNTMLSLLLSLAAIIFKDQIIPFINAPNTEEALEANDFVSRWWYLGCVTLGLLGWSFVQQEKIAKVYEYRGRLAAMTTLPPVLGFFTTIPLGGETQVVMILFGWLMAEILTIVYGHCSKAVTGEPLHRFSRHGNTSRLSEFQSPLLSPSELDPERESKIGPFHAISMTALHPQSHQGYLPVSRAEEDHKPVEKNGYVALTRSPRSAFEPAPVRVPPPLSLNHD